MVAPPGAFLHPFARPAAGPEAFVTIVRGEGAAVFDELGNRYVDALASLWYCNVGHGREEIAAAVGEQMRKLECFSTFDRFTNEPVEELAAELVALAPMEGARAFFASGGSEAVETAMKLARLAHHTTGHPERTLVIGRTPSYHGVAYGGLSATGLPANQVGFGPLVADVECVPWDDLDALDDVLSERGDRLAAIIAEPVIGAGGVRPAPEGYLAGLRERCDRHGAFLILDEVICGFGRLGRWWGAEHYGVRPDLVTFAKGVTSGYLPLGGVLVGPAVRRPLESDGALVLRHGYTYSGHPTSCAAALANLSILADEGLLGRAEKVGARLGDGLRSLSGHGGVAEVRGAGAVWAVQLAPDVSAIDVRESMMERGVIARPLGTDTIAFCPPLVIGDDDLDLCVESLAASLP
ncbi:MAG TPA: aminotransferase class III-fold pyridoxal phosphate-dependent enzyme [Acidimicrobiales bacterium]|nr:aminotransferase class III-fold pyridoxal phosphate-dependent enzyme [Acidimicrobiales bacterium]